MMKNETSFTLTKQIFFAWKYFRENFAYTNEFNREWFSDNPYNLNRDTVEATLNKAIANSTLSVRHQALARHLFFHNYKKQVLISSRDALPEDFDIIRSTLRANVGCYTYSEQERRYLEDFFDNRFDEPNSVPFLILHTRMNYHTLRVLLDEQDVLTNDEEALLSLFLLGELHEYELTDTQRLIIIDAADKLNKFFCRTDIEFYKQVTELYISLFPYYSMIEISKFFNLNTPRFRLFCNRYLHARTVKAERRKKLKDFLDE